MKILAFLLLTIVPFVRAVITDKGVRTVLGVNACGANPAECTADDISTIDSALAVTYTTRRRQLRGDRELFSKCLYVLLVDSACFTGTA